MKRRLSFTALAAVLLACFLSCEKVYVPGKTTQLGEGKYLKTIHLGLDGGQTKADDSTIADATLFVYQTSGGSETFYKRIYTESPSSVTVDLFFSDQVDYT